MPKLHLRQPGFTYSACRPFTKYRERIQRFKKTYSDSKDLVNRTIPDEILKEWAYETAIHPKYDDYQRGLARKQDLDGV